MKLPRWIPAGFGPAVCHYFLLPVAGTVFLSGCVLGAVSVALTGEAENMQAWTPFEVSGHTLTHRDPSRPESFHFSANGEVAAKIGSENATYQWKVVKGELQILDGKELIEGLTLVNINGPDVLATRRNGHWAKFRYE